MSATPDFSSLIPILNAFSSVAVIVGVVFVVIQLRQNNRLITASNLQAEANVLQTKSSIALSIVAQFTSDSFTRRRKLIREIISKYRKSKWEAFLDSEEDFEVRAFGRFYEFAAHLARRNLVDLETVQGGLGYTLTFDWQAFAPQQNTTGKRWRSNTSIETFNGSPTKHQDTSNRRKLSLARVRLQMLRRMPHERAHTGGPGGI